MTKEELKVQIEALKEEAKTEAMSYINDIMEEAKMTANKEAKKIVVQSIQRIHYHLVHCIQQPRSSPQPHG